MPINKILTTKNPDINTVLSVFLLSKIFSVSVEFCPVGKVEESGEVIVVDINTTSTDPPRESEEIRSSTQLVIEKYNDELKEKDLIPGEGLLNYLAFSAKAELPEGLHGPDSLQTFLPSCCSFFGDEEGIKLLSEIYPYLRNASLRGLSDIPRLLRNAHLKEETESRIRLVASRVQTQRKYLEYELKKVEFYAKGKICFLETPIVMTPIVFHKTKSSIYVYRNPHRGWIGVVARNTEPIDLTSLYTHLVKTEPLAGWYLHPSKKICICGSSRMENAHTSLEVKAIIALIERFIFKES